MVELRVTWVNVLALKRVRLLEVLRTFLQRSGGGACDVTDLQVGASRLILAFRICKHSKTFRRSLRTFDVLDVEARSVLVLRRGGQTRWLGSGYGTDLADVIVLITDRVGGVQRVGCSGGPSESARDIVVVDR